MSVFVAGHKGLVGSALVRKLKLENEEVLTVDREVLDLRNAVATRQFLEDARPDSAILAAARVGGIQANIDAPVELLVENLQIEVSFLTAAYEVGIKRVCFLGSSCIYPRESPQPIKESYLLSGPLEPTNSAYALAKLAGIELVQAYRREYGARWISVLPGNLYGPGDNFNLRNSHVVPALIRKFHEAVMRNDESVSMWGSGVARREFLHADDAASAILFALQEYDSDEPLNIGAGYDITITELAQLIADIVGFDGEILWDVSRPEGVPQKLLDSSKLFELGWEPSIPLREGIESTFAWYRKAHAEGHSIRE